MPALFTKAMPLQAAIDKLAAKTPVASVLNSEEWAGMPLAIRERSQFSARVTSARVMQTIQDKLTSAVNLQRENLANGKSAYVDRSSFIGDMRAVAIEEGLGDGTNTVTDITSRRRLGLIWDMQIQTGQNFARWKTDQDPDLLDAYPAKELIRVEQRRAPRNWTRRWLDAGGEIVQGRMVALKTDPIWIAINRFGVPWAPYDFGSGMGDQDISRKEAIALGILDPGERLDPSDAGFNDQLSTLATDLSPEMKDALGSFFGDLVSVAGNVIKWVGSAS